MKRFILSLLVIGAVVASASGVVFADPVPPVDGVQETINPSAGGGEVALQTVIGSVIDDLNGVGGSNVQGDQALRSLVFSCPVGTCPGTIIIEQAGNAAFNAMGIYDLSDVGPNPDRVALFDGSKVAGDVANFSFDGGGQVIVNGNPSGVSFGTAPTFGLFIQTEAGAPFAGGIFFSEDARNVDLRRHMLTFHTETGGFSSNGIPILDHSYLFAFEDLPQGSPFGDFDYNDFIYNFQIQSEPPPQTGVIPEPGTMMLFGLGGLGAAFARRRKTTSA